MYLQAQAILLTGMNNFAHVYMNTILLLLYQFLSLRDQKDHTRERVTIYSHVQ